jgi:GNAT superfamily N-acetyltransferase
MALAVKAQDDYPPRGPIDVDWFLAPAEQLAAWVAEEESSVVGHIALHSAADYASTRLASTHLGCARSGLGLIARLFVAPGHRGSGVGQALVARATASALERGLQPVLDVATHLDSAVHLYESVGWHRVGEVTLTVWDEPPISLYVYIAPTK